MYTVGLNAVCVKMLQHLCAHHPRVQVEDECILPLDFIGCVTSIIVHDIIAYARKLIV